MAVSVDPQHVLLVTINTYLVDSARQQSDNENVLQMPNCTYSSALKRAAGRRSGLRISEMLNLLKATLHKYCRQVCANLTV